MTMDTVKSSTMHIRHRDGWFHSQIDPEDAEQICKYKWHVVSPRSARPYVFMQRRRKTVYLHRFLTNAPKGTGVDHKDGNVLNNRKENLRICTRAQNLGNTRRGRTGVSGYRGVYPSGDRWRAAINHENRLCHIGTFDTPEEAARAYNERVLEWRGEFAILNEVPEE